MNWDAFTEDGLKILAVLLLVLFNGFFVAAELALVRIRDTQLDALIQKGNRRAKRARHIVAHIDAYISATQFGVTVASLALGVAVEPVFRDLLTPLFHFLKITSDQWQHDIAIGTGFVVNCYLLIVAGELVPKAIAIRRTQATALWVAAPLDLFYDVSYPFIWLLHHSSQWVLQWLGLDVEDEHGSPTEDELRVLLSSVRNTPGATTYGRRVLVNALDLRHRIARDVMRPRQEITFLDMESSITECLDVAEQTRYSRFPLCEGGDLDKMRGGIHIKDLFAMRSKARTGADLAPVARKLIYIPETARLEKVLQLFLERKSHLAVVVDEYGGTQGMVTLENILEELVGQIQDEFDQEKPLLTRLNDSMWEVAGALPLHRLEEFVREPLHADGVTTVSGWITDRLGGFPKAGDNVTVGQFELRVEETDGARVSRLKLTKKA
jgi:CBS domain containing-hemolysin-like protein